MIIKNTSKISDMNFNRSPVVAVGCDCEKYYGHAKYHDLKNARSSESSDVTSRFVTSVNSRYVHALNKRELTLILETGSRRANGVHITYPVTNEIRGVIAHCLNTSSANSSCACIWPLRPQFRTLMK